MKCETCGGKGFNLLAECPCHFCHGTGETCCIRVNRGPLTRDVYEKFLAQIDGDWIVFENSGQLMEGNFNRITAWAVLPKGVK